MARKLAGRRWFVRMLRLLPFETRRDYGADMEHAFAADRADALMEGRSGWRLWGATAFGLLGFAWREHWAATRLDLRYAWRGWRRAPLLFGTLIATMAAGIAALTTAFSVIDAVVLKPLPVAQAASLVRVTERHGASAPPANLTYATFLDLEARSRTLRHVAASRRWFANLTGEGDPERLTGALVSGVFFQALGSVPAAGRLLGLEDDRPGNYVLVISHELWQRRFRGSRDVVGRTLRVNDFSYEVVGVAPPGQAFPLGTSVWAPLVARQGALAANRRSHLLEVVARLEPNRSRTEVAAELGGIAAGIAAGDSPGEAALSLVPAPVLEAVVRPVRSTLVAVLAGAAILLLVLFTNVAHVLLVRASARQRELAVLTALGAGRMRVARLLLTESVALFLVAGLAGTLVAWALIGWLPTVLPVDLPRVDTLRLDGRGLAVSLGTAALAGLGFGLWPAWRAASLEGSTVSTLRGPGLGGGLRRRWLGTDGRLAALQLALAFALIVSSALLVRSAVQVDRIPLGFAPDGLLRVDLALSPHRLPHEADGDAYVGVFAPIVDGLEALPGVTAVGFTTVPPFAGGPATGFRLVGRPESERSQPLADVRMVDTGYFGTMGIPLRAGRGLAASDTARAEPVVVVSEAFARAWFPGEEAVDRSMTMLDWGEPLTARIVGVVGDVPGQELEREPPPTVYWHYAQFPRLFGVSLFVRARQDPATLAASVRDVLRRFEPDQPLTRVEPMSARLAEVRSRRLVLTTTLTAFAAAAVVFALVGLYGVLAERTSRQGPAFGVRLALGATPSSLVRLVLDEALVITGVGLLLGCLAAVVAGRVLEGLLYRTAAVSPLAMAASGAVVATVALLAALVPARRAARVDPASALRAE
jgi:putative ABC transport system permease protein